MTFSTPDKYEILSRHFGYSTFRTGQESLIDSVLAGRDAVGIMPTGAGKSVCFQVPALMMDGITLVISPLISLMKDQVSALAQAGIKAAYINSTLSERQMFLAMDNARDGLYKIIYITPERLETVDFLSFAKSVDIAMLTVDEAHCISQWGQDFRPSYAQIADFIASLPKRPVVSAFTATATPKVREDIISLLKLDEPTVLVAGFDRSNLYFEVQKPSKKPEALLNFLRDRRDKTGIIYCSTRKTVEEVCAMLKESGYAAASYHAGLPDRERHDNQDDFLYDRIQIMVATNAFGMGIDKSNVSFVLHYNMPKDVESYYQEAGRAGRDGSDADCVLFYSGQDVRTNLWLIENNNDKEYADPETEVMLKERDRQRLKEMTFYCTTNDCLRAYILRYFGEKSDNFCGNCGSCNTNFETIDITIDAQKILSCVIRAGQRYGVKMIIDVLRGSKNERLQRLGFDKLSTYGISRHSEKRLRDMVNYLTLNEYLTVTNDEYPILKLGSRAAEILKNKQTVEMKLSKEIEKAATFRATSQATKRMNTKLFDILKKLRLEIANEQNVPAFAIFADSTLADMCLKLPTTDSEMLNVSGVGNVKLERYGERVMKVIAEYVATDDAEPTESETLGIFDPKAIKISDEPVTVSVLADRINFVIMQHGMKKISGQRINDFLVGEGLMRVVKTDSGSYKEPTESGIKLGISRKQRIFSGEERTQNFYGRRIQELIALSVLDVLG